MTLKRRNFIGLTGMAAATGMIGGLSACNSKEAAPAADATSPLQNMTGDVVPISIAERQSRIEKAQRLMAENQMDALLLDAGTALRYFTGISWGGSERPMVAIIPVEGEVSYICPGFEEDRLRELITLGTEVYAWQEDESPYRLIADVLKKYGGSFGTLAVEERTRFFISNGIQLEAPQLKIVSGDPVTIPLRLIKSATEIALMQKASDITITAIAYAASQLQEGMTQGDLAALVNGAQHQLGGSGAGALCLIGTSTAFPHGSTQPQTLKKGDVVLIDCGCKVDGYGSDITRTFIFGAEPTARQTEIWNLERDAQMAGFAAAELGMPCGNVDAASRKVIIDAGFGPGYALPGLPHRTGHGIGMDGHEWGNMVKGNTRLLQPGMCFSVEPTIAIPGEFGIRFEDCVYMTEEGPKWFTVPPTDITKPFG